MNKPLKMLLAVGVLAFTAAGMYYALLAPSKPTAGSSAKSVKAQPAPSERDRLSTPGAKVGGELPGSVPAGFAPSPALNAPAAPASTAAVAPANNGAAVPGFSPAAEPMKSLPSELPGFEPANTSTAAATAPAPAPSNTQPAPATPAPATAVSAPAAPTKPASSVSAPPPLPAPSGAAASPAPAVPTVQSPAPMSTPRVETYTVKEGDSIVSIWRDLTGSERGWEQLQQAQSSLDPSRLKIGQVLKVPDWKQPAGASKATAPVRAPAATPGAYTVQSGDTLSSIATKVYGDSKLWKRIYDANKDAIGSDPGALKVGQSLRIPPKTGDASATPASTPAAAPPKPAPGNPAPDASPTPTPAPKPQSP
ncbi:MAG: LysM peptidoglycan-binding domain-containing protein [Planctomycetes bacterium]|nr:LysM peptidoglycan-binding domain-containing protein [Planctomycetota bacterium]